MEFTLKLERSASFHGSEPQFILSARRHGDDFYISRYETFSSRSSEGVPLHGFIAIVRAVGGCAVGAKCKAGERRAFELVAADGTGSGPRAPLAAMNHSWFKQPDCGAEIRTIDAYTAQDTASQKGGVADVFVWDSGRENNRSNGLSRDALRTENSRTLLASQIPRWDPVHGCLVMKFQRSRVKESSSKNFILFRKSEAGRGGEVDASRAAMQFGKVSLNEYALDFKAPVAPLHAFAIALSSFAFTV